LLFLSLLGGDDSFCRSMGRGQLWCLVWGVVDCGVSVCSWWRMRCRSKFRLTWALMPKEESKFICGDVVYLGREEIWAVSILILALMAVRVCV